MILKQLGLRCLKTRSTRASGDDPYFDIIKSYFGLSYMRMREFILSSLIGICCDANYLICCNLYSISVLFYCYINFVSLSFTFDKIWKGIVLIDFEKAQWADNIIVI